MPRVVAADADRGFALLSWIDGAAVEDVTERDIDAAVAFLAADSRLEKNTLGHPAARGRGGLSRRRRNRAADHRARRSAAGASREMNRNYLISLRTPSCRCFDETTAKSKQRLAAARLDFASELPQIWRSLVPSDFGFHNSLRRKDGSLAFLDFEYFGWDDPVKLTADIMLHPGRKLGAPQQRRFRRRALVTVYGEDQNFAQRLDAFYPLFGLRWVLILLNEFIPERWRRRVIAGAAESWSDAKARQLKLGAGIAHGVAGRAGGIAHGH